VEVAKAENVDITKDGIDAILALSGGDMRRVLNLLQSTVMSVEVVNETSVYLTSGAPLPSDIAIIFDLLLDHDFQKAFYSILDTCSTKGYALADVLHDLTPLVTSKDFPPGVLADLLDGMSNVEYRLSFGTDEKLQIGSLVGVFTRARHQMTPTAQYNVPKLS
jgi:replication factor C subunit 3/5